VGVGRLVDRRHWTSDTVLGALFGYAVGKEIALRSLERRQRDGARHSDDDNEAGGMWVGSSGSGVVIGYQTRF
jgi:hypothetical protein